MSAEPGRVASPSGTGGTAEKVWMVCNNCGHVDSGPAGSFYECVVCGWGDGWGAEDNADAVRRAEPIIKRGRFDV